MWPSGANFNRSFPGRPDGPPNEQLADYFTRVLFPMSDVVIDMHSGGRTAWFLPCSHMHVVDDPAQRKAMLEAMQAWNSEIHFLYVDVNGSGLLARRGGEPGEARRHDRARRRRPRAGAGARARVERADERAAPRRRARGRGRPAGPACADPRRARPAQLRDRRGGRHLRRAARAGRDRAGGRPRGTAVVPRSDRPRADRAARAARRRARGHPLDPGGRGRRLASSSSVSRSRLPPSCEHRARAENFRERPQAPQLPPLLRRPGGLVHRHLGAADRRLVARPAADALARRRRCARADAAPAGDGARPLRRHDPRPLRRAPRRARHGDVGTRDRRRARDPDADGRRRGLGDLRARARARRRPGGRRARAARARLPDGRSRTTLRTRSR